MNVRQFTSALLLLAGITALGACGFHLRGSDTGITEVRINDLTRQAPAEGWTGGGPDEMARTLDDVLSAAGIRTERVIGTVRSTREITATTTSTAANQPGKSQAGVTFQVLPAGDGGMLTVELVSESLQRRVASVATSAAAAEYQIDHVLRYRILGRDGAVIARDTTLKADRSYRFKSNAILGSADEEAMLQHDMRRDAAQQIVRHLRQAGTRTAAPAGNAPHANQP